MHNRPRVCNVRFDNLVPDPHFPVDSRRRIKRRRFRFRVAKAVPVGQSPGVSVQRTRQDFRINRIRFPVRLAVNRDKRIMQVNRPRPRIVAGIKAETQLRRSRGILHGRRNNADKFLPVRRNRIGRPVPAGLDDIIRIRRQRLFGNGSVRNIPGRSRTRQIQHKVPRRIRAKLRRRPVRRIIAENIALVGKRFRRMDFHGNFPGIRLVVKRRVNVVPARNVAQNAVFADVRAASPAEIVINRIRVAQKIPLARRRRHATVAAVSASVRQNPRRNGKDRAVLRNRNPVVGLQRNVVDRIRRYRFRHRLVPVARLGYLVPERHSRINLFVKCRVICRHSASPVNSNVSGAGVTLTFSESSGSAPLNSTRPPAVFPVANPVTKLSPAKSTVLCA